MRDKKIEPYFRIKRDLYGYAYSIERVTEYTTYDVLHLYVGSERNEELIEKVVKALNGIKVNWPDAHFTRIRQCKTCAKQSNHASGCAVLTETIGKDGPCWAWTDDPGWEQKVKSAVAAYAVAHPGDESEQVKVNTFDEGFDQIQGNLECLGGDR